VPSRWDAPSRVEVAAETRYLAKVKKAQDACEKVCEDAQDAQKELMKALDHRETKEAEARMALSSRL
jgi:hypothetical protein